MVDCVTTMAPLSIQGRPFGAIRASISPLLQATTRLLHVPSSHRYSVPASHCAEPGEYALPFNAQFLAVTSGCSAQAIPDSFHCPSSHRYVLPDWHTTDVCEYLVSLYWQPSSPNTEPNGWGRRSHPAISTAPTATSAAIFPTIRLFPSVTRKASGRAARRTHPSHVKATALVEGQGTCRKLGLLRAWFYAHSLTVSRG